PSRRQRSAAHGFSVRKESGPASTRQPPTCSVARTPPKRGPDSYTAYSSDSPSRRRSSSAHAAASPEIPPPTMAMRFIGFQSRGGYGLAFGQVILRWG